MKRKIFVISLSVLLLSAFVLAGCGGNYEAVEHHVEERYIYFTAVDGDIPVELEMAQGAGELRVAMDNGELWITLAAQNGTVILDTDATFSADFPVQIPEAGTYTLTLKGKGASGSVNY